jgi:amino acid transporter
VSYNAIQISLYGLLGATLHGLVGGAWWLWAGGAWLVVALLGVRHVAVNARILAIALLTELAVIGAFDLAAFTHPYAGTVTAAGLDPRRLFVDGVGGVLALGVAAFVGYECGPVYGEEAKTTSTVARATFAALGFLGLFYAVSAWAMTVATGPDHVVDAARDPDGGLPFGVLHRHYGAGVALLGTAILITSILAAMVSFHNGVARYCYALGRERVLPAGLARVRSGPHGGAPIGGSLSQSVLAALVIATATVTGADPIGVLFTWLSTLAAIGILALLVTCSWAALRFFRAGGGTNETALTRTFAPTLGVLAGLAVLATVIANVNALLGVSPGSPLTVILPGIIATAAVAGLIWGRLLRRHQPAVFAGIGLGRPHPLATLDHGLSALDV